MPEEPPKEAIINYLHFDISADRCDYIVEPVPSSESPDGVQHLPVGIYKPSSLHIPEDTVVIRGFAWSASNQAPYQRGRTQFWADSYGIVTVAPNTVGQGIGSPDLNGRQKEQLAKSNPSDVGRVMLEAAIRSYEARGQKIGRLVLLGESQFPTLMSGIVEQLPDIIELSHIIIYNPAGTERIKPNVRLWPKLKKASNFFDIYRARNPIELQQMEDTNIIKSIWAQSGAHVWNYRRLLAGGGMAVALKKQLDEKGFKPEIHLVSSENDLCSTQANEAAAKILRGRHVLKKGHDHAYTEYVPAVAKELADILK
jgi:hypothetical protein